MRPIPASISVSGCAYQHVTDWLNKYDNQTEKLFKQISAEVAYTGIAIFAAFETVARGVYALALKGFCHFAGKDEAGKKAFTKKYIVPAGESFLANASVMGSAALSLKDNLSKLGSNGEGSARSIINGDETMEKVTKFYYTTFAIQLRAMGFRIPN